MRKIFLTNYRVSGIKNLSEEVSLSFYKKTITKNLDDTKKYNVKGIYGMNGSGKTAIINSVEILKNLLINPNYLNNDYVQNKLDKLINKTSEELAITADFIYRQDEKIKLYIYKVVLYKKQYRYVIKEEELSYQNAAPNSKKINNIFKIKDGMFENINIDNNELVDKIKLKTMNLLDNISFCPIFIEKFIKPLNLSYLLLEDYFKDNEFFLATINLGFFANALHIYLDESDMHIYHVANNTDLFKNKDIDNLFMSFIETMVDDIEVIGATNNRVPKKLYNLFEKRIEKLSDFLHIFKHDLIKIEIDKKIDGEYYVCDLNMRYENYAVNIEYESAGIKKLVKLYAYLNEMVNGGIVFIDEFDSKLHDVYLCALLEYLMEYGEGQLCFTTHNVGPMDVLNKNKKSIEFLSENHKIYSWIKSGNYSPSNLYRNGIIEGSPFNIDSFDFIVAFDGFKEN